MTVKNVPQREILRDFYVQRQKGVFMKTDISISFQSPKNGAKQYGLDTSVKVQFSSAVHNTTMAVNLARKS